MTILSEAFGNALLETITILQSAPSTHNLDRDIHRVVRRLGLLRKSCDPELLIKVVEINLGNEHQLVVDSLTKAAQSPCWQAAAAPEPSEVSPAPIAKDETSRPTDAVIQAKDASSGEATEAAKDKSADQNEKPGEEDEMTEILTMSEKLAKALNEKPQSGLVSKWVALLAGFFLVDSYVKTCRMGGEEATVRILRECMEEGGFAALKVAVKFANAPETSTDLMDSKIFFCFARICNLCGNLQEKLVETLLKHYRTATLERKHLCVATCVNQILHSLLDAGQVDRAVDLVQHTNFPHRIRSTCEIVRCYFNLGRIQSIRLEYSNAHEKIMTAIRKLPPGDFAFGFKILAYKHAIVVELLMGDIPPIQIFTQREFQGKFKGYEDMVHAVGAGDLTRFNEVYEEFKGTYAKDGTLFLVNRLRHSVIKTGLRKINLAYSCISLANITTKLGLSSVRETESVLNKCILDGVVLGRIDQARGCLVSKSRTERQLTMEPSVAFDKRIKFCCTMYEDAIKSIQYPEEASLKARALEADNRRREMRDELLKAAEDEDGDDYW